MNETRADSSAPGLASLKAQTQSGNGGWSRQRWLALVALVFAAQVALIFALGAYHFPPRRVVTKIPILSLAESSNELIALNDPTLFALPHLNDFASAAWQPLRVANQPPFRWIGPPGELLSPADENLGAKFARFMQTNQFAAPPLDFKPRPELSEPVVALPPAFAPNSTLQIEGALAQRKWLNPVSLTNWPYAGEIAPSKVQVSVDPSGEAIQAVLLPPDNSVILLPSANPGAVRYVAADHLALELARTARFAPASRLTVGLLIFNWRAVPPATNSPSTAP